MKRYVTLICIVLCVFMLYSCSEEAEEPPDTSEITESSVNAYRLTADGSAVAYIDSPETADMLTEALIEAKTEEAKALYNEVISVTLLGDLQISEVTVSESEVKGAKDLAELKLLFYDTVPFSVTARETETREIPFETVYQKSSAYYEGTSVTKTAGKNGERTLAYDVVYTDGAESSRTLVSDNETKAAENKVVLVGTKKSTASTGSYAWPLKSVYITSDYGGRTLSGTYDFHLGLDLRAATGTYVYAADGGEVIFAGKNGSYGYLIKIRHDNGDLTYYAHLSKIEVAKGSRVYKGQYIAKSGATGNVTGPHLHFEIRKNSKTVDPKKYLPKI